MRYFYLLYCLAISLIFQSPVKSHAQRTVLLDHRDKLYDTFVDGKNVWVVGAPGRLLFSQDSGASFEARVIDSRGALMAIDFGDKRHGLIVSRDGYVLRTQDGGNSWTKVSIAVEEPLFDVDMVGPSDGWVVGHFNTILHTRDGGSSWQPQHYEVPEDAIGSPGLHGLSFVDQTHGWIVGEFGTILHTDDGGVSWRSQDSGTQLNLYAVHFSNRLDGVAVGALGTVLKTADGGNHWTKLESKSEKHLFTVSRPSQDSLFAAGQDGVFILSNSYSKPLEVRPIQIYTWLSSVTFFNRNQGIAVGGRGHILTTDDGGKTWKKQFGK